MKNIPKPRFFPMCWLAAQCVLLLAGSGCKTYFRTGETSYQELADLNQAAEEQKHMIFKPGDVIWCSK